MYKLDELIQLNKQQEVILKLSNVEEKLFRRNFEVVELFTKGLESFKSIQSNKHIKFEHKF